MNPSDLSGFDPTVQDQLAQIALDQERRQIPQHPQPHTSHRSGHRQYNTYIHPRNTPNTQTRASRGYQPQSVPGLDAFPPLGSVPPAPNMNVVQQSHQYGPGQGQGQGENPRYGSQGVSAAAQDFFGRSRGRGRGRAGGARHDAPRYQPSTNYDSGRAPPPLHHNYRTSNSWGSPDRQRQNRLRAIAQADYLDNLAHNFLTNMLTRDEIEKKHLFRQNLEGLARKLWDQTPSDEPTSKPPQVKLQSYGSLSNSFGTSGCDVDLLLTVERELGDFIDLTEPFKRDLEKTLLDQGIGARLLTNTRIPIIRVCEKPSPQLLKDLRAHCEQRENVEILTQSLTDKLQLSAPLPTLTEVQNKEQANAAIELAPDASEVPLPQTPTADLSKLEFIGECGIQCDINFTNRVALYNTKMLWTYGQCDIRVRHMGIFIKNWAKARDINTPYRGTLSSYGYVLMVLHYLINVANPPVLPNLQELAQHDMLGREPPALFESYDVRFTQDSGRIRERMAGMPKNQNSLGGLLHGFFRYYTARDGFNWTQDVISIRTSGGILSKQAKGWTGAKWTSGKQNVRLRYLLAIEDPFELEHNVARTVGHNGIKAIRDEFRRSWNMIENIQRVQGPHGTSWTWINHMDNTSGDGLGFIEPREDRGDLLKKDAEFRKEQLKLMKQKVEADEEQAKKQALVGGSEDESGDLYGMSAGEDTLFEIDATAEDQARLIHDFQLQDKKVSRMRGPNPGYRTISGDEDDEDEDLESSSWHSDPKKPYESGRDDHRSAFANPSESPGLVSDDWATSDETRANSELMLEGYGETPANNHEVIHHSNNWDDWNSDSQNVAQSAYGSAQEIHGQSAGSDWCEEEREITNDEWSDPASQQPAVNAPPFTQQSSSPASDWNDDLPQVNNVAVIDSHSHRYDAGPLSPRTKRGLRSLVSPRKSKDDFHLPPPDSSHRRLQAAWQYSQRVREPDCVGSFIRWSSETVGGRWLLQRDAKIRAQKCVEYTAGDKGRLSARFPYDPRMTRQELVEKNILLQKYYKDTMYPRLSLEMHKRSSEQGRTIIEATSPTEDDSQREINARNSRPDFDKIADAGRIGSGIYWSTMTEIGKWLRWRDRKILDGKWQPGESLAADLSALFPRSPNTTVGDMTRMNWELDHFFDGLIYPRANELSAQGMDDVAGKLRDAIHRTLNYRESKLDDSDVIPPAAQPDITLPNTSSNEQSKPSEVQEPPISGEVEKANQHTEQGKLLLDMFKNSDASSLKPRRPLLDPSDQQVVNDRSMQAVMNLSEQLSRDPPKDVDFVRAQRLAFFQKKNEEVVETPLEINLNDKEQPAISDRRDSGAEGSWNQSHCNSSTVPQPCHLNRVNLANLQKTLKSLDRPTRSGEELHLFGTQHDPASTDSSAGEIVPNTLKSGTWRERWKWSDRFEDPRIMPIPRTPNYAFDPEHLKDLENVMNGGNGCAREGQNAFRMESNRPGYPWGGGGVMAQSSVQCSTSACDKGEDKESIRTLEIQALLAELPGIVEE